MVPLTPAEFVGDILVVDDDLPSLRVLSNLLMEHGYQVRGARNGSTALMMVGAELPDLILLDIQMPGVNGFQVCEELKRNPTTQNVPILFISASDEVLDKVQSFEIGGVDYINKPFREQEILARIKTHLSLSKLHRDLIAINSKLQAEILERERVQLALQASQASLRAQYEGIPVPTITWKKDGDDLILVDYNRAAARVTQDNIGQLMGIKASEFYQDQQGILKDLVSCLEEKKSIERECEYTFKTTGETRYLAAKYAFVPPDSVLVHTEDVTEQHQRLNELIALHDISQTITTIKELPQALEILSKRISDLFGACCTFIVLRESDGFELKGWVGYERTVGSIPFSKLGKALDDLPASHEVFTAVKPGVHTDLQALLLPEPILEYARSAKVRSGLTVPLISPRIAIGVLILGRDEFSSSFSQFEINLAETIAADIAAAIENDRLTEQARLAAVDAERQRLARDLHDSATQSIYSLTLLSSGWESMARQGILDNPAEAFRRLGEVGQQALREMRLLLHQLRPSILEEKGLVGALQQRLDHVELRANIEAQLIAHGDLRALPQDIETELFNIAQEALNNSLRYSQAESVRVVIDEVQGSITLTVEDDGIGFDTHAKHNGMGLGTMQERAASLSGKFVIYSEPDQGTRITVSVPALKDKQE
jgi:signal transduction histidine kinase/DNA-binding response OmpR family regulator